MIPENNSESRSLKQVTFHFIIGAMIGFLLLLLPLSYGEPAWNLTQIALAILLPLTFGLLSAVFGERCLKLLTGMLDSLPHID